jgi:hypothetical protein
VGRVYSREVGGRGTNRCMKNLNTPFERCTRPPFVLQ